MTARQVRRKNIVICLDGMTACGKSTAARRLAQKYRLKYVSGEMVLKELALRLGYKSQERGWLETTEMPTHDSKSRLTQNF
jgi:cytidylate kinase